jgi:hypothetical protein
MAGKVNSGSEISRFVWRVLRRLVWKQRPITRPVWLRRWRIFFFCSRARITFPLAFVGLFARSGEAASNISSVAKLYAARSKVQDILDTAVASVVVTGSSGLLANVGIIVGIYFGTVLSPPSRGH